MQRAALYARFSSDLQRDQSIEDQLHLCRSHAARMGWRVVAEYSDRARSGASIMGRDGLLELIAASKSGAFDLILVESLDRLSRDQEDLAGLFKRCKFDGIGIEAVHGGTADTVQIGVRSLLGSLFLEDLKNKTRRGMAGVIREGRSAGGRQYGYRPIRGQPGQLEIVEEEAAIVRRIYEEYADGRSGRTIVMQLNKEGVPAPRGREWRANTVIGNKGRGGGILKTQLYEGIIVWGRVRMVVDPATGRRVSRPNDESEWQTAEAPHLRIIAPELVSRVRARQKEMEQDPDIRRRPRKKRLLSGLLKCGACGGPMSAYGTTRGRTYIRCSRVTEAGTCSSTKRVALDGIEETVLYALQLHFADPELVRERIELFIGDRRKVIDDARRDRDKHERRLGEVKRAIDRIVDHLAEGLMDKEEARPKLERLRVERAEAEKALATASEEAAGIELHPATIRRHFLDVQQFRAMVADATVNKDDAKADTIRRLIGEVVVTPGAAYKPPSIEIKGRIGTLLDAPYMAGTTTMIADPKQRAPKVVVQMVAGGRVELPTSGL